MEMKETGPIEMLVRQEVPGALDQRILAAAALRARGIRRRRFAVFRLIPATAAAAAVMVGVTATWYFRAAPVKTAAEESNLLALNDWSEVEQQNYNLSFALYNGDRTLSDLALNGNANGGR